MGATAFIIIGSRPNITYGLPNPGYILILYENSAPVWEIRPLYPEIEDENILWVASINKMLEDALLMIGLYIVRDSELRKRSLEVFGKPLERKIEVVAYGRDVEKLREINRKVLPKYDIGLVLVPLEDSTVIHQLDVLKGYGNLWVSVNPPKFVMGREEW